MSRPVDDLAARLRQAKPDRWDTATVLEVIDDGHVRVDLGDSQRTAVVPSGLNVAAGQSVEVTVSGRVTTVRRPLDGGGGGFVPAGSIVMWYAATPPAGWLICDGATFAAATYPALAAVLGGTTLPDMRGRFPVGVATSDSSWDVIGEIGGKKKSSTTSVVASGSDTVQDAGTDDNLPPYRAVHFIIRT